MERNVDPAQMLTDEHDLIERVVAEMKRKAAAVGGGENLPPHYAITVADFFQSYADACHHGKEEFILFARLGERELSTEDAKALEGLLREHEWARKTTAKLRESGDRYAHGESGMLPDLAKFLRALAQFYPQHTKKEEDSFFPASRRYFSDEEWSAMADDFDEFDRGLIHRKYTAIVEQLEAGRLDEAVK